MWVCYCLVDARGRRTYVGKTNRLDRRVRQHNGELVGGARATRACRPWRVLWYVSGFTSNEDALRFEWRMHHSPVRRTGAAGRVASLVDVCSLARWTRAAPLAATVPLRVHMDAAHATRVDEALHSIAHVDVSVKQ